MWVEISFVLRDELDRNLTILQLRSTGLIGAKSTDLSHQLFYKKATSMMA